ncbi:MAG: hypothetical protein JNL66_25640 [Alphaproteobacteria bacterium]|nr:hypothetical protein [Alphaproteobacteria bacterium]
MKNRRHALPGRPKSSVTPCLQDRRSSAEHDNDVIERIGDLLPSDGLVDHDRQRLARERIEQRPHAPAVEQGIRHEVN